MPSLLSVVRRVGLSGTSCLSSNLLHEETFWDDREHHFDIANKVQAMLLREVKERS
jgi:hypothetical protein